MARKPRNPVLIDRVAQLRALVSPVRQELVDMLQALGTASIADLAERMGRPADGLYYHVRALVAAGLVQQAGTRSRGGREEAVYCTLAPEEGMRLRYPTEGGSARETLQRLVASMVRTAGREFKDALARPETVASGPRRELWAARSKGWLSTAELAHANRLLVQLVDLLSHGPTGARDRLLNLTFVLAPGTVQTARRGRRKGGPDSAA